MKFDAKGIICDYPALELRRLLRRANGHLDIGFACHVLDVPAQTALDLTHALESSGYLEKDPKNPGVWLVTVPGSALAMASAGPPLKRAAADKLLLEFIARVEQLRDDPKWCYLVDRAVVFGSYLSTAPTMGDVDIGVSLRRRYADDDAHEAAEERRRQDADEADRSFPHFAARLFWPRTEVGLFLKARRLSLHELEADWPIIRSGAHVTVYCDDKVCRDALPLLGGWNSEQARDLSRVAAAERELRSAKRKTRILKRTLEEMREITAELEMHTQAAQDRPGPMSDEVRELIRRAEKLTRFLPDPTDS